MMKLTACNWALVLFLLFSCKPEPPSPLELPHQLTLEFTHSFKGSPFAYHTELETEAGNQVSFSKFQYLLSNFALLKEDGSQEVLQDVYAFINPLNDRVSLTVPAVPGGNYRGISFQIGLDSLVNHGNPNDWGADHPLNPLVNNMHWSWAGGYIFLSMEGTYEDNGSQGFSYHIALLENRMPIELASQNLVLDADRKLTLDFDVASVFGQPHLIDIPTEGSFTHSTNDGGTARKIAENTLDAFTVSKYE